MSTPLPDQPADHPEVARLSKNLKPHWVWAIALGSAVGWGAFVLPADWLDTAGPLGALLGLAIGGALMIVVGVSYGFLAKVFPASGGAFAYTLVGFGRTHAYICAWFMTLGYVSIVALNASALGLLAERVIPQVAEVGHLYTIAEWDVSLGEVLIVTAALVIFALINIVGGGNSARLQFSMCLLLLGAVTVILVGVLASPQGQVSNMEPLFSPDTAALAGILAIVAIAPWFGRTALGWIVDMASIGFTFAFAYTCLCAYRMFRWSGQPEVVEGSASTPRKLAAAAGVVVALIFTVLLLAPGSPAQMTMPSFIAMGAWVLLGLIFYVARLRHSKTIGDDEVDTAVLGAPRPDWARRQVR